MTEILNYQLERFKRIDVDPLDVWEGTIARMPGWVTAETGRPYRPRFALWRSAETGLFHTGPAVAPEEMSPSHALDALLEFASNPDLAGYRPGCIRIADPALADWLAASLGGSDTRIERVEQLELLGELLEEMCHSMAGPAALTSALDGDGVDLPRVRAFADAAAAFHRSRLWHHLSSDDLIRIDQPAPEPELSWFSVLGAGGETIGLAFFASPADHEAMRLADDPSEHLSEISSWSLGFGPITRLPFPDADLFEDHALAIAQDDAYPCAMRVDRLETYHRPDARTLAFLECLLRALAATTEEDLDNGHWKKKVTGVDGPAVVSLSLPEIIEPPAPGPRLVEVVTVASEPVDAGSGDVPAARTREPGGDARSRAAGLVADATMARGRRQIKLAREALSIDPDCADAYVLLADCTPDPKRKLELYRLGMEASERTLDPEALARESDQLWLSDETRAYMYARFGMAVTLDNEGRVDEAIAQYRDILTLNPDDDRGVRTLLIEALINQGLDTEAEEILAWYAEDQSALFMYARALLAFRKGTSLSAATRRLHLAFESNDMVPDYLIGAVEMPEELPEYFTAGNEDEAISCAAELGDAWRTTEGAIDWLETRFGDWKRRAD